MVLVGVLIVFLSLKMQASRRELLQMSDITGLGCKTTTLAPAPVQASTTAPRRGQWLANDNEHQVVGHQGGNCSKNFFWPRAGGGSGLIVAQQAVGEHNLGILGTINKSADGYAEAEAKAEAEAEAKTEAEAAAEAKAEASADRAEHVATQREWFASWMPTSSESDAFMNHQVTIETVLSMVLSTATVAGFRPHQTGGPEDDDGDHHCCLHHAVQVSSSDSMVICAISMVMCVPNCKS